MSSLENRMSVLETDVKAIKQITEKTHKMVQNLAQQFGKALETISDQMEKMYSQSRDVDDHDVNQLQEITVSESKQAEASDNEYIEDDVYMVPPNTINTNAPVVHSKQPPHPPRPPLPQRLHHDYLNTPTHVHNQSDSSYTYTPLLQDTGDDDGEYTKPKRQGEHYSIIKKLAEGKSGHFWLAGRYENRVVVKEVNTADIFTQEMNALKKLSHTNIVKVVHVELENPKTPSLTLTFEYAINKNLHGYLKTKKSDFSDQQLLEMAVDVANGMKELEKCSVIHCDLRAHNVLVDGDMICKVASFNKAHCLQHGETNRICQKQAFAVRWQAPEVLDKKRFSNKSDVWSFGVLLYEIFSFGSNPYPSMNLDQVRSNVMGRVKMSKPEDCPEEVYQIMKKCFEFYPSQRTSFSNLHQQLQNIQTRKHSTEPEFDT